ncbi:unnamed protein product [Protopolystoma xenopodis]|uniref:Uncharacterized protein n=1 Tax=Protopolystoma xenopodis TaxID=117903 RepID=A0A448WZ81_9PLAT|nr:unnamed protein product [Protopolystoma xenopodis]
MTTKCAIFPLLLWSHVRGPFEAVAGRKLPSRRVENGFSGRFVNEDLFSKKQASSSISLSTPAQHETTRNRFVSTTIRWPPQPARHVFLTEQHVCKDLDRTQQRLFQQPGRMFIQLFPVSTCQPSRLPPAPREAGRLGLRPSRE